MLCANCAGGSPRLPPAPEAAKTAGTRFPGVRATNSNGREQDLRNNTVQKLGERTRKGQFRPGNRVAVGNRGGGRPPSELRAITTRDAARVWRELRCVAFDARHPLHDRHAFEALRELPRLIFPRAQAVALEDPASGEGRSWKDCIRLVVGGDDDAQAKRKAAK
jgi:hypothetical protein